MTVSTTTLIGVTQQQQRYLISAPGKVILFGEHAVVHQKLAIAASLGLRTYMYLERTNDGICKVDLPDVGIQRSWSYNDLMSVPVTIDDSDDKHPINNMAAEVKERLISLKGATEREAQDQAILAFLYLFFALAPKQDVAGESFGFTIHTRSMLPVSAGLGSSASYSSTVAAALLILFGRIPFDFAQCVDENRKKEYLELVNRYAFKSEQVIHGNPSGVDNAVTTFGGAKTFRRGQGFETLEGFQSLRLLLTNTRVPRSTSALVAGVGAKKTRYPTIVNPILDAIDGISLRCKDAFRRHQEKEIDSLELITELEDLVDMNHCLLQALGVSHASLEQVRSTTAEHGIVTKLTGAGGGGCALSIIRDNVLPETIKTVTEKLESAGLDCYQTSLGGIGVSAVLLTEKEDENWMISANRDTLETYFR